MKQLKIPSLLLLNDIHFGKDNLPESIDNWREAIQVCEDNKIKTIVVGGDMFQSRSSQTLDVLLAIRDLMIESEKAGIDVILANGNHCKVNQESIRGYCHVFDQHRNVKVVDKFVILRDPNEGKFALTVIPYFPETGSFKDVYKSTLPLTYPDDLNILYLHEGINGALKNASDHELPADMFQEYDKVLVGHYHGRCKVKGSNVEYIGSSRQHNYGEDEEKGYTIVYSDGSTAFIKNQSNTRYRVIDVDVKDINKKLLKEIKELKDTGYYKIKVKIHTPFDTKLTVNKQELIDAGVNKIEIITEDIEIAEVAKQSIHVKFDKAGITSAYREFADEKNVKNSEFGLKYLGKIECIN